jgi:hypothetical protein
LSIKQSKTIKIISTELGNNIPNLQDGNIIKAGNNVEFTEHVFYYEGIKFSGNIIDNLYLDQTEL